MKLHRFIGSFDLKEGNLTIQDSAITHQMREVLRLRIGEEIIICDGQNNEASAMIENYDKQSAVVRVWDVRAVTTEPEREVTLYCAVLKKENFEWVVQKTTELGVAQIVPIITARTVKLNLRADRLEKIAREAAEQSGRGRVPMISEALLFTEALAQAKAHEQNFFCTLDGTPLQKSTTQNVGIFIGPEGGWDSQEIQQAKEYNCELINLGPRILRGETAAIVGIFALLS